MTCWSAQGLVTAGNRRGKDWTTVSPKPEKSWELLTNSCWVETINIQYSHCWHCYQPKVRKEDSGMTFFLPPPYYVCSWLPLTKHPEAKGPKNCSHGIHRGESSGAHRVKGMVWIEARVWGSKQTNQHSSPLFFQSASTLTLAWIKNFQP